MKNFYTISLFFISSLSALCQVNSCGTTYLCDGALEYGNAEWPADCDDGSDELLSYCCQYPGIYTAYGTNTNGILACENYYSSISGCTDPGACNYDPEAVNDDGSCSENDECGVCDGDNSTCGGCTDPGACNYDPEADVDDGSCAFNDDCGVCEGDNSSCGGCTDPNAVNYDPFIIIDDGSCDYGESLLVTNTNNSGPGSFREIVVNANDGAVIRFHQDLLGQTINLNITDELEINSSITIKGIIEGEDHVTINLIQDQFQGYIMCNNSLTIDSLRFINENEFGTTYPSFWLNSPSEANYNIKLLNSVFENFDSQIFKYYDWNSTGFNSNSELLIDNCQFLNNSSLFWANSINGVLESNLIDSVFVHNTIFDSNSSTEFQFDTESVCYVELVNVTVVGDISGSGIDNTFDILTSDVYMDNVNLDQTLNIHGWDLGYGDIVLHDISINLPSDYDMYVGELSGNSVSITACDFVSNMDQEDVMPFYIRANNVSVSDFNSNNFLLEVEDLFETEQSNVFFDRCNFQSSDLSIHGFQSVDVENSSFQNSPSSPLSLYNNINSIHNCTFTDNVILNNSEYTPILLIHNLIDAPSQNFFNNITVSDDNLFITSQVSSNSYDISNSTIICSPFAFYIGNLSDDVSISFYNSLITDFTDAYGQIPNVSAPINLSSEGFNIFTNILGEDFTNNNDLVGITDFDLMPLAYYGGFTKTMPPNECSPALDAGDPNNNLMSQNLLLPVGIRDIGAAESDLDIIRFNCFNGDCIEVYDASGEFCTLTNCLQECQNGLSISEHGFNINIYPNPSSSIFKINFYEENEISEISVTNILGQEVYFESVRVFGQYDGEIDLSKYSNGIYNLSIKTSAGLSSHQLILQ